MRFMDKEITDELTHMLRDRGAIVRLGESIEKVEKENNEAVITLKSGKRFRSDLVMFAAGRTGCTSSLGLKNAGLEQDGNNRIEVNKHYQTKVKHIYAAGDLIGFPSLASTSMEQGRLAARHAFGLPLSSRPDLFPFGVYAVPEMSMVGKTEEELTEQKVPYEVGICATKRNSKRPY